jgi:hypothetical protein
MIKIKTLGGLLVNSPLYAESPEVKKEVKDFIGKRLHAEGCPTNIEECSWNVLDDKYLTLKVDGARNVLCTPFGCEKIGSRYIVKPFSFISRYGSTVF